MDSRPNILIIMSDQRSKHFLGSYGNDLVRTPHLDVLAQSGMRLDNAYCPSPLCVPSRMSFMTGRYPSNNRVWDNSHVLSSAIPTWAHAMGVAGYETALVGRMHFVGPDQRHGFERRPIGEYFSAHPGSNRLGAPLFTKISLGTTGQGREAVEVAGRGRTSYQAMDDLITDAAVGYLKEKSTENDRPFAAVVGYVLPHCPFVAPKELFDYYYERVDIPRPTDQESANEPASVKRFKKFRLLEEPLSDERIRVARAAYFGLCEYMDMRIGEVLDTLKETGLSENTLVIYTSDHGETAGEHGCWWKSNYYEGSVGVPMIATLPGVIAEKSSSSAICNLTDLGSTVVDVAGADPMPAVDGQSLWPTFQGQADSNLSDETFSEHTSHHDSGGVSRMIRRGRWKLHMYHGDKHPALFDLDTDPGEMNDLGADKEYQMVRDELMDKLMDGWDPSAVEEGIATYNRDNRLLTEWGGKVQPIHEDTLPVPVGAEDIELL